MTRLDREQLRVYAAEARAAAQAVPSDEVVAWSSLSAYAAAVTELLTALDVAERTLGLAALTPAALMGADTEREISRALQILRGESDLPDSPGVPGKKEGTE